MLLSLTQFKCCTVAAISLALTGGSGIYAANARQPPAAATSAAPLSAERWINDGWHFLRLDPTTPTPATPEASAFDDAAWETVALPHNAHIERYDEPRPWQGICWYRKQLTADPAWRGRRVGVQFGAAMQAADVWVNGVHRLRHVGGYLPFTVDLTAEAQSGQPIEIAVQLDNRDTTLFPPGKPTRDLDFAYPGGLYRGVRLIVTDPVHISDPIEANIVAGGGVFVTYSNVTAQHATVQVKTDVANEGDDLAHKVTVRSVLLDAAGQAVTSATSEPTLLSGRDHHEFVQTLIVDSPQLWSPDHPNRYRLRSVVSRTGTPVDQVETPIGIRTVTLDDRLRINGQEVRINGSNRHQEYPYIEYALSPNASRRDAQRIKDGGFNFIRLSHYPQDPAFLDACDALGIMVQAPIPGWQIFQNNPSFVTETYRNIRELIRRDRNHPSIVFWEPNLNETSPPAEWSRTAYEIAHEEYPGPECYTFGDSYGPRWKPGWDVKYFWREYGDFGFGGNESTSRQVRGGGESAMLQQAWNFQWDDNHIRAAFDSPGAKFYGDATWCMFDYNRGYYKKQEMSGMMDIFRLPKYVYAFYQSQRDPSLIRSDAASGPFLFLATDWNRRGPKTRVVVFSNCDEVALLVNGKEVARHKPDAGPDTHYSKRVANIEATVGKDYDASGGNLYDGGNARHLDHPPFTFDDVAYAAGTVQAVGYHAGKQVAEQTVRTPEETPKNLRVRFDTQNISLAADGADTVFVRVEIADRNGTIVPINAFPTLKLTVTGPARLIGTEPIHVEAGVASILLQATDRPGSISVTATADGMPAATATITSQAYDPLLTRTPAAPPTRPHGPVPTQFTRLTGRVIGTPGAYADGPSDISKAFDGDLTTYVDAAANTNGNGCWVGLDLGTPRTITRIRFYPRKAHADRMSGGRFQGSNTPDFANPVDLYQIDEVPPDNHWIEITDLASSQSFRYVRYLSPDDGWNNVAEIEFDASP